MTNILLCDDEGEALQETKSKLGPKCDIRELAGDDLKAALTLLFKHVRKLLPGSVEEQVEHGTVGGPAFKDIDVAIVDNNLSALDLDGERLTAEAMIDYLRAFTDIPYIISLNKNPDVDFDLGYMVGDHLTRADLALNTEHLAHDVLWQRTLRDAEGRCDVFAPSYWPNIHHVANLRRNLVERIASNLDGLVLDVLEFPSDVLEALSRHAKGVLAPQARTDDELRGVTCKDFFLTSCGSLPPHEREVIADRAGAHNLYAGAVARTVAADLEKWVRRDALGPQDVLVDLPHLLARMPFLLEKDAADVRSWNRAIGRASHGSHHLQAISDVRTRECVEKAEFPAGGIFTRWPCFWWHSLRDDEWLKDRFFNCDYQWADAVFCEDVSQFIGMPPPSDGDVVTDGPKEFEAEFGGTWVRRYIRDLPDKKYSPRSRLAV